MATRNTRMSEEEKLINNAIKNGVNYLVEAHPIFGEFENYILHHIDQKGIIDKFSSAYDGEIAKSKSREDALKTAYKTIESYIASGNLLDEKGKNVVLKEGLKEETGVFRKFLHGEVLGEKYLNKTINTAKNLSNLMESGDYAERHQEMADAINQLKDAKFHYAATRVLKEGGLIDDKQEQKMLKVVYKRVDEQPKRILGELEQKLAASVIAFVGILLILFNIRITGAVIGGDSQVTGGIVGVFMLLFALLLFFRPLKRTFKK